MKMIKIMAVIAALGVSLAAMPIASDAAVVHKPVAKHVLGKKHPTKVHRFTKKHAPVHAHAHKPTKLAHKGAKPTKLAGGWKHHPKA